MGNPTEKPDSLVHLLIQIQLKVVVRMVASAGSVAVVGAGIIGGSTALEIQALIPGVQVTIFSEDVTPDTTADGAAGIFGLYLMGDTPTADQVRLLRTRYSLSSSTLWTTSHIFPPSFGSVY